MQVAKAYPVHDEHYKNAVTSIHDFLDSFGKNWTIGHNGMHRYNNQDHFTMPTILTTFNCLGISQDDSWMLNTGNEYIGKPRIPPQACQ